MDGRPHRPALKTIISFPVLVAALIPLAINTWHYCGANLAWQHAHPHADGVPGPLVLTAILYPLGLVIDLLAVFWIGSAQKKRFRHRSQQLAAWRQYVPSPAFGPIEPEEGFYIYVAQKEVFPDHVMFRVRCFSWSSNKNNWSWQHDLDERQIRSDIGISDVKPYWKVGDETDAFVEYWVQLCQRVGEVNARNWQLLQQQRTATIQESHLRQMREQAQLSSSGELFNLLPDANEILTQMPQLPAELPQSALSR